MLHDITVVHEVQELLETWKNIKDIKEVKKKSTISSNNEFSEFKYLIAQSTDLKSSKYSVTMLAASIFCAVLFSHFGERR